MKAALVALLLWTSSANAAELHMSVSAPATNSAGSHCPFETDADGEQVVGPPLSDLGSIRIYLVRFSAPADTLKLSLNAVGMEGDSLPFDVTGIPPGSMGRMWSTAVDLSGNESCIGAENVWAIQAVDFQPGLVGDYFADQTFTALVYSRDDAQIDFNWGTGVPAPGVPGEHFSVRWTGTLRAALSGSYRFRAVVNDAGSLKLGPATVFSDLSGGDGFHEIQGNITLQTGAEYPIDARMLEKTGSAQMTLYWTQPGMAEQVVPTTAFEH